MNYATIKWADVSNGPGVRVSLFVSGCTHCCPGCFNPEAWDFQYGQPFTQAEEDKILAALSPAHMKGLSLLGGEPFEPDNQRALLPLLRRTRNELPGKTIWCYSGYTLDGELWQPSRARCEATDEMLSLLDVLRIIDVPKSLAAQQVVLWDGAMTVEPITAR